jgi:MYXO-CTERM domain-containing protein
MSFRKSFCAAAVMLILGAAGAVRAQTCVEDRDCPQGFACHAETVVPPTVDCKPGAECVQPDASAPMVVKSCEPKSCSADADCGTGMVCYEQKSTTCSGGAGVAPPACPSDRPCEDAGAPPPKPPEEMCTTTTTKMCAFKWQLPCNMDSDCGAGFSCKPMVIGSCSGSSGTATPGTGGGTSGSAGSGGTSRPAPIAPPPTDAGAAMPPMCTTMTSYPGYCQPTVTKCTVDADCPANWKCTEAYDTPVASDPPPGSGAPLPPAADAGAPAKMCTSVFAPPARDTKVEEATPGPTGNPGGGGSTSFPTPPPSAGGADAGTNHSASKSSGCAVGAGGSSSVGVMLIGLLGFAALRRRRR